MDVLSVSRGLCPVRPHRCSGINCINDFVYAPQPRAVHEVLCQAQREALAVRIILLAPLRLLAAASAPWGSSTFEDHERRIMSASTRGLYRELLRVVSKWPSRNRLKIREEIRSGGPAIRSHRTPGVAHGTGRRDQKTQACGTW